MKGTARVGWSRVKGRSRGWAEKGQGGGRCIWRSAGSGIEAVCIAENSLSLSYVRWGFVGRVRGRLGGQETTMGRARLAKVEGTGTGMASVGLEAE